MVTFLLRINILLSVLFLCATSFAQVKISGSIKDFDTKKPVDSARILLELPSVGEIMESWSDSLGNYTFNIPYKISDGDYPISISRSGNYDLNGIVFITHNAVRHFFLRQRSASDLQPWKNTITHAAPGDTPLSLEPVKQPVVSEEIQREKAKAEQAQLAEQRRLAEEYRKQQLEKEALIAEQVPVQSQDFEDLISVPIEKGAVIRVDKVYFNANATFLRPDSYQQLDRVVEFLKSNPNIQVEIAGHTNNLCDDDFCLYLSDGRAKSVKEYLVSKGIPAAKLSHKGYGKSNPIANNNSTEGRLLNQRVELKIIEVQ